MDKNLDFEAIALVGEEFGYASAIDGNGLYEVNLRKSKCRYIMIFPNENINEKRIHSSAVYYDLKIYFIPMAGEYISVYDTVEKKISQISIPIPKENVEFYNHKLKFCKGIVYKEYIYLIPFTYPGILRIDIRTNAITVINDWVPQEGYFFRGGVYVDSHKVIVPSGNNNIILEFNPEKEQTTIHYVGVHNNGSMCVFKHGNHFVIAPRLKGSIIIWNPIEKKQFEITEYPKEFDTGKIVFSKIICCKERLYLMPASANMVLSIDEEERKVIVESIQNHRHDVMTVCMFETENYYYFREEISSFEKYNRYRICKNNGVSEPYNFYIQNSEDYKRDLWNNFMEHGSVIRESKKYNLMDYLKQV